MNGLRIKFDSLLGWSFALDESVSGLDAVMQDALVLMAVRKGHNAAIPSAGADLMTRGVLGLCIDRQSTQHQLNFAAAQAKELLNLESTQEDDVLTTLLLQLDTFNPPVITIAAYAETRDGKQIGNQISATP